MKNDIVKNYKNLVAIMDQKLYNSTLNKVKKQFTNSSALDAEISKEMEKLGFCPEMILSKNEIEEDGLAKLDKIEEYLEDLVELRNQNVGQQIISNSIEQLDEEIQQQYKELQTQAVKTGNDIDAKFEDLYRLRMSNRDKIGQVQKLIRIYRNDKANNRMLDEEEVDQQLTDEDLAKMETKYKKIVEKNLMLSHFVTDLITSMNNCDIAGNEELQDILLECSSIKDYDLIDK